jgi:cobalt-zinc-cadmium efflux system membrane fusion protein
MDRLVPKPLPVARIGRLGGRRTRGARSVAHRWPLADQRPNRGGEVDAVEVHHEVDDIAAALATTTIPNAFEGIDGEAVGAAAFRARPNTLVAARTLKDFNEEMLTQVFTPYQGRIIGLFAKVGDEVKKGQTLFTIDSPDLLTAESNLVAAEGVLELTTRNLARLRKLYETRAVSQKDLEQAVSDQQTAAGARRAGRDAVRIFGKTESEIDAIIKERKADPTLVVPSPIGGRITARNAAPGLFVQPGSAPAPFTVADISTMWMLANVAERDVPAFRIGQRVMVSVVSFPGEIFEGKISTIDSMVDPNSRRLLTRSEIADPKHELRSGMFATFVIRVGDPMRSLAVPLDGVVREGDGTKSAWVTTDRRRFTQRTVKIGMQKDGFRQILEGLRPGELVAGEGAVFLSNMLVIGQTGG